MKPVACLLAMAVVALPALGRAAKPIISSDGTYNYTVGVVPTLNCPANLSCEIILHENEKIIDHGVHTGDQAARWLIRWNEATTAAGKTFEHIHVSLVQNAPAPVTTGLPATPDAGAFTNLTIDTDAREYHVFLRSVPAVTQPVPGTVIAFYDPNDLKPPPPVYIPPPPTPTPDPLRTELAAADCNPARSHITGSAPFYPLQVCVGVDHYFVRVSPKAPGAVVIGFDVRGHDRTVNWAYYDDGYYVVPAPERKIALLSGDGRAREEVWIEFR
jgi:hypothetical protein